MELIKNSVRRAVIEGWSSDGAGVCRIDGMVVFVKGGARGDVCDVRVTKARRDYAYGIIERMIEPSESRIAPTCPAFWKCGGCDFQHVAYQEELRQKTEQVNSALRRIGGIGIQAEGIIPADSRRAYRNKSVFALRVEGGRAVCGFYRPRSHDIVPALCCELAAGNAVPAAREVCGWIDTHFAAAGGDVAERLRGLFIRTARGGGMQVCLVASGKLPRTDALAETLTGKYPEISGIVLNINKSSGNAVLGDKFIRIWGERELPMRICGNTFMISPESFFQVNTEQAERLYSVAAEYAALSRSDMALDLYCGAGTISLALAERAGRVIGAEIVPEAVRNARRAAADNSVSNAEFINADAGEAARVLKERGDFPDVIVMDPPRKGLSEQAVAAVCDLAPARAVYVSCDPQTLARDLRRFAERGYMAERLSCVDMFPMTSHVETVALLRRRETRDR